MSNAFDSARLYQKLRAYVDRTFEHSVEYESHMTGAIVAVLVDKASGQARVTVDGEELSARDRQRVAYALEALPALKTRHDREVAKVEDLIRGFAHIVEGDR